MEVAKEKKRVEVEVAKKEKLDDKTAKNVQTTIKKAQISKQKVTLLVSNPFPKKKI